MRAPALTWLERFWQKNDFLLQNLGWLILVGVVVNAFVSIR